MNTRDAVKQVINKHGRALIEIDARDVAKVGEKLCEYCGAPLRRKLGEYKCKFRKRLFCNRICSNKFHKGNK